MRGLLLSILNVTLRIFFRRVEVRGREHLLPGARLLFVLNHPNGLVDPLFVLLRSGRRVSFLAKAPLFQMPVLGAMLRSARAIPVYRKQDETGDTSKNQETFAAARRVLADTSGDGGAIAIFPEGTSHNDPTMKPLKTGAARIALAAAADGPVHVVPAGLYYTAKTLFRSAALVSFGSPLEVPARPGAEEDPPAEEVKDLTRRIAEGLREVTLQADRDEALSIVDRADRVLAEGTRRGLGEEIDLRRRLEHGYSTLRDRMPARMDSLVRRLDRFERELTALGLSPRNLAPSAYAASRVTLWTATRVLEFVLLIPLATPGIILHFPAYLAIDRIAHSYASATTDALATAKILAGMLLFPLTWVLLGVLVRWQLGTIAGLVAALIAPLTGYAALRFTERIEGFRIGVRAFGLYLLGRRKFLRLVAERDALRSEITALAAMVS